MSSFPTAMITLFGFDLGAVLPIFLIGLGLGALVRFGLSREDMGNSLLPAWTAFGLCFVSVLMIFVFGKSRLAFVIFSKAAFFCPGFGLGWLIMHLLLKRLKKND